MASAKPIRIGSGGLPKEFATTDTVATNNLGSGTANSTTFLRGDNTWATPPGGSGSFALTEVEIDFGSYPVTDKEFTVVDALISGTNKIIVMPSGNTATGRVGNDFAWDSIGFTAVAGSGQFTLYAVCNSGSVVGARKIFYTFS